MHIPVVNNESAPCLGHEVRSVIWRKDPEFGVGFKVSTSEMSAKKVAQCEGES